MSKHINHQGMEIKAVKFTLDIAGLCRPIHVFQDMSVHFKADTHF